MNKNSIQKDFSIIVFSQDVEFSTNCTVRLKESNYQVESISDYNRFVESINFNTPHVIVLDLSSLIQPLDKVVESILKVSSEIKIIFSVQDMQFDTYKSYYQFNVVGIFSKQESQVAFKINQLCLLLTEGLYRLFQNEQIYQLYLDEKKQKVHLEETLKTERSSSQVRPYLIRIAAYKSCQSKEELLDVFYQQTPFQSWIYLKFIPSIETFVGVSHHQIPENWVEGLSYKVMENMIDFQGQIFQGIWPKDFENYLQARLNVKQLKMMPLIIKNNIEGIMVSTQDISADTAEDFTLMSLVYMNLVYESQPKYLDVEDSLTGFYNHLFYRRVLEKEHERSKRSLAPMSVIKISIDKFIEIETTLGRIVADEILKKISNIIDQTSRLTDYVCRTAENEFSIILVNCSRTGAAVRAERLREFLLKENFVKNGIRLSISQGISEYPTTAKYSTDLDESAQSALHFISNKGGDKICLAKPTKNHHPDFVVAE